MCHIRNVAPILLNGKCGRSVLQIVGSALYWKLVIEALIKPTVFIWMWRLSMLSTDGTLRLWGCCTSWMLADHYPYLDLLIWLDLSVTVAPMVPILSPLLLLAPITNALTHQIGTEHFQGLPPGKHAER